MNATTIEQLALATVTGSLPFPEIVRRLIEEGVEYYVVDYRSLQFRFYGAQGGVVEAPLAIEGLPSVQGDFDLPGLQAAILDSQTQGQKFKVFSRRAMSAGVQSYYAFLRGKRVTYLGRQGDQHVEWFPGAAPTEASVAIRRAIREDMPGLWEVRYAVAENTLTPGKISDEELRRSIEEDGCGWVAEDEGRILGFAIGLHSGNVWALFVRPEAEGRGIGSALHAEMLEWFSTQRLERLWLSTGITSRARGFYEARGWQYAGPYGPDEVRLERQNAT